MSDFFHGWRRKLGSSMLVLALVLAGFWMRSQFAADILCCSVGHESEVIISEDGTLSWWRLGMQRSVPRFWNPDFVNQAPNGIYYFSVRDWGVELGAADSLSIPYWPFVIPLTFFSTYLILWNSKPKESPYE